MSEYPGDEQGTPIPFLKIYGEPIVAPAPTVWVGDEVYLYVEVINMGTAVSYVGDRLTGFLCYGGSVFHQESVDIPPVEADGGVWKHMFKFDGRFVMTAGDWELAAMITLVGTIGEVQDDHAKQFVVSARD